MKMLLKSAIVLGLMTGAAQPALAAKDKDKNNAPAAPASTGIVVPGMAVANLDAVIANSNAFKVAQQQRPVTYKAQIDSANTRRGQLEAQIKPLLDKFTRDRSAATANTPAGQASLQQQAAALQKIQESGQQELQSLLQPLALSEAYVLEQIQEKLNAAVQTAMTKKNITLVLNPQATIATTQAYNLNQGILDELNAAVPSAVLVPPTGWEPREVREQKAAQAAAQQQATGQRPATPAKPSTDGR
jgi:Skp family chaperone for outer membrane proteins